MIKYYQKSVAEIASWQKIKLHKKLCQVHYAKKMISYGLHWDAPLLWEYQNKQQENNF